MAGLGTGMTGGASNCCAYEHIGRPGRELRADVRGVAHAQALVDAIGDLPVRRAECESGGLHHRLRPAGGGGHRAAQARPLVQPAQVGDPLHCGRHDSAARAQSGPDPRGCVGDARRLQGAQGPEPGHRPDAGAADGAACLPRRAGRRTGSGRGVGLHAPARRRASPAASSSSSSRSFWPSTRAEPTPGWTGSATLQIG